MPTHIRSISLTEQSFVHKNKKTKKEILFAEMEVAIPWKQICAMIQPHYHRSGHRGRQPYPLQTMLRVYFMQNWFGYSDPAMEEALYENQAVLRFSGLCLDINSIPDETTILSFRRLLEEHKLGEMILSQVNELLKQKGLLLKEGSVVDAAIIHAS